MAKFQSESKRNLRPGLCGPLTQYVSTRDPSSQCRSTHTISFLDKYRTNNAAAEDCTTPGAKLPITHTHILITGAPGVCCFLMQCAIRDLGGRLSTPAVVLNTPIPDNACGGRFSSQPLVYPYRYAPTTISAIARTPENGASWMTVT